MYKSYQCVHIYIKQMHKSYQCVHEVGMAMQRITTEIVDYLTRNATALKLADPATRGRARARARAIGKPCNHATRTRVQTM